MQQQQQQAQTQQEKFTESVARDMEKYRDLMFALCRHLSEVDGCKHNIADFIRENKKLFGNPNQ